jgi:hypothetical protein
MMMKDWSRRRKRKIRWKDRRTRRNGTKWKTSSKRSSKKETKDILVRTSYVWHRRSRVQNLVWARFSVPIRADSEVHSASCAMGTWSLSTA